MSCIFPSAANFSQHFNAIISVEGLRGTLSATGAARKVQGTFRARVLQGSFAPPDAAADAETNVRLFTISIPKGEWLEHTPPQTGDRITVHPDSPPSRALKGSAPKSPTPEIHLAVVGDSLKSTGLDIWSFRAKEVE